MPKTIHKTWVIRDRTGKPIGEITSKTKTNALAGARKVFRGLRGITVEKKA
jgi:hypothetical protein